MNRLRAAGDDGYSLSEVVVTLAIMSVLMMLFTTAILQIFRSSGKAESTAVAQSQLQVAFQRFDRELRYSSWISSPAKVGTAWYVEFASSDGKECVQLRLETASSAPKDNDTDGQGVLQLIRWVPGTPPAKDQPGQTIASQLLTDTVPFELQPAGTSVIGDPQFTPDFQRLRVALKTQAGTGKAEVNTTFTALNTSRSTPATNTCSEGRPTS